VLCCSDRCSCIRILPPETRHPNPPQGFGRIRLSPRLIRPLADFGGTCPTTHHLTLDTVLSVVTRYLSSATFSTLLPSDSSLASGL
jgi:hypothetical protein